MYNESDQDYINLVLAGNANAFANLVDRYKEMVFTLCLRMLRNREEAEEAAQDTFIKTFKSLERYKGDAKFSTWLYKIAYNNCLDRLKKQKRRAPVVSLEITGENAASLSNVFDSIDESDKKKTINECLNLMEPEERFLLILYYLEEKSLKEISDIMNINTNNLKIKLFRGRKKLAGIVRSKFEPEIINSYEKE